MFPAAYSVHGKIPAAHLPLARWTAVVLLLAAGGCASSGGVPRPFPRAGGRAQSVASALLGAAVAQTALGFRGVPYRNGGSDPGGFDCSGLVWYVLSEHGVAVPRTVEKQYDFGSKVPADGLAPGDLVFFRTSGSGPTHVGIMTSRDEFIHAPNSHGQVRVERIDSDYWARRFLRARRIPEAYAAQYRPLRVSRRLLVSVNCLMWRSSSV